MGIPNKSVFEKSLMVGVLLSWLAASLISLNHLFPVCPFISNLSTTTLGWLGWCAGIFVTVLLGKKYLGQLVGITMLFFTLGYLVGPFLSPAADPVEHLKRVYELNCGKVSQQVTRENYGFWQYSMAGIVLCPKETLVNPKKILTRIDVINGLFWALMAGGLFVLGIRAGLPGKWAFLSVLICFLFWGTNRISYFRYYSFAPSCSSIILYWLWTASFFFRKKTHEVLIGLAVALLSIPILWVNHRQEAVFLGYIVIIWLIINVFFTIKSTPSTKTAPGIRLLGWFERFFTFKGGVVLSVFVVFFVLPQLDFFRKWLVQFFVCDYGHSERLFFLHWLDLFIGKHANALRVKDTLGMTGVVMLVMTVPYFLCRVRKDSTERKVRIYVLAILPFIGYFVPFFHFIWASNIKFATYYRLCYSSMFWLFFADFLFCLEQYFSIYLENKK